MDEIVNTDQRASVRDPLVLLAADIWQKAPDLRWGQAVYHAAHQLYPETARLLSGTMVDPFYNNALVPVFLDAVARDVLDG